jgi:carboxymethylenebutenolidase
MKIKKLLTAVVLPISISVFAGEPGKNYVETTYNVGTPTSAFDESVGQTITFEIPNEHPGSGYLIKSKTESNNWLFIYHDRYGLTSEVKEEAYALWKDLENVNVLAIDLYDGKVAQSSSQAMRFLMSSKYNRNISIIQGALDYVGPDARIGSLGWSAGGSWSLQTAIHAGERNVACVVYYGMPENNVEKLKDIQHDVLAIFANQDTWITPNLANSFKSNMDQAGKSLTVVDFEGAGGFADKKSMNYDKEKADEAYNHVISYLKPKFN